jgi:hypothetical protein
VTKEAHLEIATGSRKVNWITAAFAEATRKGKREPSFGSYHYVVTAISQRSSVLARSLESG